jgi:VWFA-related protein
MTSRGWLAALAMAATPLAVAAQFSVAVDGVRLEALVLDGKRPVAGLTAADFVVTDQGVPQTVAVRALAGAAIDVIVALDTSGSVRGTQLERLRAGSLALISQLAPTDRATLVVFNHAIAIGPRDTRPDALMARLQGLAAGGRTSLLDAATSGLVWASGRDRPMLVIVFSDGRDTSSWTRPEQALALARKSTAVVDAVVTGTLLSTSTPRLDGFNMFAGQTPDERFLTDLAALTGGHVRNGASGAGLTGAFKDALEQFRARYEISYTATDRTPGWHAIDVQVKGRRGVTVHARRGYQR